MQLPHSNNLHIFIGPTLYGVVHRLKKPVNKFTWHPPVKRNDIKQLMQSVKPSVAIIVDGYFHNSLAVGHAEIREAIKAGWVIWGLSSMGAIRASEMISLGMKGYGLVYKRYVDDPDFRDDEVALLHGINKPFTPVSEPLIHIRYFLNHLRSAKLIRSKEENKILKKLSSMWYGDRTLFYLKELLKSETGFNNEKELNNYFSNFDKFRIKSIDFTKFIEMQPWENKE
jgi:hypothetical protein